MSDSVRPHRRQPTRLPYPWDSPGKNTGVGCHFLLQCRKVKSESEVAQSCPTLSDPMDCSPPGSSVHGIFQARVLEWGVLEWGVLEWRSTGVGCTGVGCTGVEEYWSGVYWSGGVLEWGAIAFSEQGLAPSHSRVGPGSIHQPHSVSCSLD